MSALMDELSNVVQPEVTKRGTIFCSDDKDTDKEWPRDD